MLNCNLSRKKYTRKGADVNILHITKEPISLPPNLPILQYGLQPRMENLFADHSNPGQREGFYILDKKISLLAPTGLTCFGPEDLRKKTPAGEHWSMSTMALVNPKSVQGILVLGQIMLMEKHHGDGAGWGCQTLGRAWGAQPLGWAPWVGEGMLLTSQELHSSPKAKGCSAGAGSPRAAALPGAFPSHLVFTLPEDRAGFPEQIPC